VNLLEFLEKTLSSKHSDKKPAPENMSKSILFALFTAVVAAQQSNWTQCPNAVNWNQWHIGAGGEAVYDVSEKTAILTIGCLSGQIFDEYSGHPGFSLYVRAPEFENAEVDITYLIPADESNHQSDKDASDFAKGLSTDASFVYQLSPGPAVTSWQLVFVNNNGWWNADFNFTMNLQTGVAKSTGVSAIVPRNDPAPAQYEAPLIAANNSASCKSGCTPTGKMDLADCAWYTTQKWLPDTYTAAAACACQLQGVKGALSDTAMCVRNYLMTNHKGTDYFSQELKTSLAEARATDCWVSPTGTAFCSLAFGQLVHKIVPLIYGLHKDAYSFCCCPGEPAPLWAWEAIFMTRMDNILKVPGACLVEAKLIESYGPCGCDDW
jgi:hypothetical protein